MAGRCWSSRLPRPSSGSAALEAIDAFATLMAEQAREFYGDGTIADEDLRLTAVALTGAVNETVAAWLDDRLDVPAERLVDHCARLFVAAAGVSSAPGR